MKKLFAIAIFLLSFQMIAQSKKMEISNNIDGKTITLEDAQEVKISTINRGNYKGNLTINDAETVNIEGQSLKLDDIINIKIIVTKKLTTKKIVTGVGLGIVATSGILAATSNGNAFSVFAVGTGTTIVGGLLKDKNKNYSKRKYTYKIIL